MLRSKAVKNRDSMLKSVLRYQLLVTSVIPTTAVLVVGVVGIGQMATNPGLFTLIFLTSAMLVFLWEYRILRETQHIIDEQCTDLITTCQEFMHGNKERRTGVTGEGKLATLTHTINMLLDQQQHLSLPESIHGKNDLHLQENDAATLNRQIAWLTEALRPVLDGDLRVKVDIQGENVEVLAGLCNEFVDKLALFTRWILYMSEKVLNTVHTLSDHSLERAQATETQVFHLSAIAEKADKMGECIQYTQATLHQSNAMLQSLNAIVQQKEYMAAHRETDNDIQQNTTLEQVEDQPNTTLEQLTSDIEKQRQRLKDCLLLTQETQDLRESLSADIITFSQAIHQSDMQFLEASKQVSLLITHVERWRNLARTVLLTEDVREDSTLGSPAVHTIMK